MKDVYVFGDPGADTLLFQMVDDHDLEMIEQEVSYIRELTGEKPFCLTAVRAESWREDLSPWPAPAVFGDEAFGDGAAETLAKLLAEVVPERKEDNAGEGIGEAGGNSAGEGTGEAGGNSAGEGIGEADGNSAGRKTKVYLGGYSLSGLFALWAGYQTDRFDGIAAASPSVWFPQFTQYMRENRIRTGAVYLSLGDREERTRDPVMSQVGNAIREGCEILKSTGTDCVLEWNKGNHFKEPDLRTAKAFAWLMNRERPF